jgi:hypothetical protein
MRVLMQFNVATSPCPITSSFGEMEDYCVDIQASDECLAPGGFTAEPIVAETITISWEEVAAAVAYEADFRLASGGDWLPLSPVGNSVVISNLDSCENYTLRVKTICTTVQSLGYSTYEFDTCPVSTEDIRVHAQWWQVMPNPFHERFYLERNSESSLLNLEVVLLDALGRKVQQLRWRTGENQLDLDGGDLPAGLYNLLLYRDGQLWSAKRILKD